MKDDLIDILSDLDALNTQQDRIEEDNEIMEQRIQCLESEVERLVVSFFFYITHFNLKITVGRLKTEQTELECTITRLEYRRRLRSSR
jgi:hypothetical protein